MDTPKKLHEFVQACHRAFHKAANGFQALSPKRKFAVVAAASAVAFLAMDNVILPLAFFPKLRGDLRDAFAADSGRKVDETLNRRYASAMWKGVLLKDEWGDKKREFLRPYICDAVEKQKYDALGAVLKNDPEPFRKTEVRYDDLFFFMSSNVWVTDLNARACSVGKAIEKEDTQALDAFLANGIKVEEGGYMQRIAHSKILTKYFVRKGVNIDAVLPADSYSYDKNFDNQLRAKTHLII